MSIAPSLEHLLARFGSEIARGESIEARDRIASTTLPLGWPELDAQLPDGGLPQGVVEIAAPRALGGATSIALSAVHAAHAKDARSWCAWLDPEATLYAPGVLYAGVDLARLLIIRPPRSEIGRIAVKATSSRAFDVVVVDMDRISGDESPRAYFDPIESKRARSRSKKRPWPPELLVRKLALLSADAGTTVILLTDSNTRRETPWPVSLRLECTRTESSILLRVAKDRRGRTMPAKAVPLATRPRALRG
jgi:hypothetical protein